MSAQIEKLAAELDACLLAVARAIDEAEVEPGELNGERVAVMNAEHWKPIAEALTALTNWGKATRAAVAAADEGAKTWTPPPGTDPKVLHGSIEGPELVALVTLEPGAEWPEETHPEHEELVLRLTGGISVRIRTASDRGSVAATIDVTSCFNVPSMFPHTVRNESTTERAKYLSVMRRMPGDA